MPRLRHTPPIKFCTDYFYEALKWFRSNRQLAPLVLSSLRCPLFSHSPSLAPSLFLLPVSLKSSFSRVRFLSFSRSPSLSLSLSLYIIHTYIWSIIYACMYAYMYACMHVCMYACMHVCMYACMHACMYACMYALRQKNQFDSCIHSSISSCPSKSILTRRWITTDIITHTNKHMRAACEYVRVWELACLSFSVCGNMCVWS